MRLQDGSFGHYAFDIGARKEGGYSVQREECTLFTRSRTSLGRFVVAEGKVLESSVKAPPAAFADRLYLVNLSGMHEFRPLYDALSSMGFYNLNPDVIRELQSPDPGMLLTRDGSNLASVLGTMVTANPALKVRIEEYLSRIVPGISGADTIPVGPKETIQFRQDVSGAKHPWRFIAANMSDGTLRALGILVALFQAGAQKGGKVPFVGIEEPETALHPAAAGVLIDSLREASDQTQVAVTSHSPELLDDPRIPDSSLLAVVAERGETKIGRLDNAGRSSLRDHLFTAGDLLRMDQLRPEPRAFELRPEQLVLFGTSGS